MPERIECEACRTHREPCLSPARCPCACTPHLGCHCVGACSCHGNSGYAPQTGMGSPGSSPVYRDVA